MLSVLIDEVKKQVRERWIINSPHSKFDRSDLFERTNKHLNEISESDLVRGVADFLDNFGG